MKHTTKTLGGLALTAAVAMTAAGCDGLLEVRNPNIIDAETIDPVEDAPLFAESAFQSFAAAHGTMILYMGWYTGEAWVGDTFPTRNEYGRRAVEGENGTHSGIWGSFSRGLAQSEQALDILGDAEGAGSNVNLALVALSSGYSILTMADAFCEGTIAEGNEPGPRLSTSEMLAAAVNRLSQAVSVGDAGGSGSAGDIANAARVGLARAHLQAGNDAEAASVAAEVDPDFEFELQYVDQPGARGRLGNDIFQFSAGGSRESLVVPPAYRDLGVDLTTEETEAEGGDPRILFFDAERDAQDNTLRMWSQLKYPGWGVNVRLASGLEARYIEAEANLNQGNPADALLLINERREAGGHGAFAGTGDAVLDELMTQKSIDLWLEGKRMGDWRRNGNAVPFVTQPGAYYKEGVGSVGDDTCWTLPNTETRENPNFN